VQVEGSQGVVVLGHGALSLEDLDVHTGLVISVGGEHLGLLGRDGSVTLDQRSHDTSGGLNTQSQRGNIQQQQTIGLLRLLASQDGGLDGSTVGNGLIGVDGPVQFLASEEVGHELLNLGDTGGTTDQDDLVDGTLVQLGVLQHLLARVEARAEQVGAQLLETSTGDAGVEVDTLDQGVDFNSGLRSAGKRTLCALASSAETTKSTGVGGDVLLVLPLELLNEVVDKPVVEVLSSQVSISGSGLDLEDTTIDGQKRNIEGTTSQVEDQHVALLVVTNLVQSIGNGGGGRLVDDTQNLKTGNGTSILGSLTLGVVEVGRDGDNSLANGLTKVRLSGLLHLDQHHGGDFLRQEDLLLTLVLHLHHGLIITLGGHNGERPVLHVRLHSSLTELTANQTLSIEHGVHGVHGHLVLGGITDQTLRVGESDIGGSGTVTLIIGNDLHTLVLPHSNTGVGGSQIDSNSTVKGSRHFAKGC
jgi:hypothetical protein